MKTWNIASAKFYSEMMNGLASFFGASAEDVTEAELHQKLIEAGTLESVRAAALQEANEAVTAQMADFKSQLAALQSGFDDLKADSEAKAAKVVELETDIEAMRGKLAEKETQIGAHLSQIQTLSGSLASLKAGKTVDIVTPLDASLPVPPTKSQNGGVVVTTEQLNKAFEKVSNSN